MVSMYLLTAAFIAGLGSNVLASEDLLYPYLSVVEGTKIDVKVICGGSDSPVCLDQEATTEVTLDLCPIPFLNPESSPFEAYSECLSGNTVGANFPDMDKSDVISITVTLPKDFKEQAGSVNHTTKPELSITGGNVTKIQLRRCFHKFSTMNRVWRTDDAKDEKHRLKRDKSCIKIVEYAAPDAAPDAEKADFALVDQIDENNQLTWKLKVAQSVPHALFYFQVRYLCDTAATPAFLEYNPDLGMCGFYPPRANETYLSFQVRPIEVSNLPRVRGPLVAMMFVAPIFLAVYFLQDFLFKKK